MLCVIKERIRVVVLTVDPITSDVPTGFLYVLSVQKLCPTVPEKAWPILIAAYLAKHGMLAKVKGGAAYFDDVNGPAILEMCRNEQQRTLAKLHAVVYGTGNP
jgi:hypothetical protein